MQRPLLALGALRNVNEIYRYAKICRVSNVIRPYVEAL
jgi:hypothetical protein